MRISMKALIKDFIQPISLERKAAIRRLANSLATDLKTDTQALGQYVVGCGATHGVMEKCDFGCTSCYLSKAANHIPALPFDQVELQLQALRAHLGPGGNVQITSGEVTLLPAADLIRIIEKARQLKLSPMVMTHGDRLLADPSYLEKLVAAGLRKISIHIDTTQRGRRDYKVPTNEIQLNFVRAQFAELLERIRHQTGVKLKAASTMTVTHANIDEVPFVLDWFLDHRAFRILSLQPQAQVGRTQKNPVAVDADAIWHRVESHLQTDLNPHPFFFGHHDCTRMALWLVLHVGRKRFLMEAVRKNQVTDRNLLAKFMRDFGGLDLNDRPVREQVPRVLGVLFRKPWWILRALSYAVYRLFSERKVLWRMALCFIKKPRLRVRAFCLVIHSFMDAETMATEVGKKRLSACAFKVPYQGEMVSMCAFNGLGIRDDSYQRDETRSTIPMASRSDAAV